MGIVTVPKSQDPIPLSQPAEAAGEKGESAPAVVEHSPLQPPLAKSGKHVAGPPGKSGSGEVTHRLQCSSRGRCSPLQPQLVATGARSRDRLKLNMYILLIFLHRLASIGSRRERTFVGLPRFRLELHFKTSWVVCLSSFFMFAEFNSSRSYFHRGMMRLKYSRFTLPTHLYLLCAGLKANVGKFFVASLRYHQRAQSLPEATNSNWTI